MSRSELVEKIRMVAVRSAESLEAEVRRDGNPTNLSHIIGNVVAEAIAAMMEELDSDDEDIPVRKSFVTTPEVTGFPPELK